MANLNISLFESIYLIYMFLFFKTTTDFNLFSSPKHWLLDHSAKNYKENRICPFGKIIIFLFISILIGRHFIKFPKYTIHFSIVIGLKEISYSRPTPSVTQYLRWDPPNCPSPPPNLTEFIPPACFPSSYFYRQ